MKADLFGRIEKGTFTAPGAAPVRAVRRNPGVGAWWLRPISRWLAGREAASLRRLDGLADVPWLLDESREGIVRTWIDGEPMQIAKPDDPHYFAAGRRLLHSVRSRGVIHVDTAKKANWLVKPDGTPALVDLQCSLRFERTRGWVRMLAKEDLRHLLKHKKGFCPDDVTAVERGLIRKKSLVARVWLQTGKRVYMFITRRILDWSDGEGHGAGRREREAR